MLLFPKKYITLIRLGKKDRTLRVAGYSHWNVGQRSYIPTVGYIVFDTVERATLENLSNDDIAGLGFENSDDLQTELLSEYSLEEIQKHLWKIVFHVLPAEEQERIQEERKRDKTLALKAIRSLRGADTVYGEIRPGEENPQEEAVVPMSEQELVAAMANRCTVYRSMCTWEGEPARSDFFRLFLAAPRDSQGVPVISGDWLRLEVKRAVGDEKSWDEIKWIVHDVCTAWNQWQYAIKKWSNVK